MAEVIIENSDMDFTGSNGGRDIPCYVFDSEPTAEQQADCLQRGISMEWSNGAIIAPDYVNGIDYERQNEISLSAENILRMFLWLFVLSVIMSVAWAVVEAFLFP